MSFLSNQESRLLMPSKSLSPRLAFGQARLSTAWGEADYCIRLKCYDCVIPAEAGIQAGLFLLGKRELGDTFWTAAFARMICRA